MELLDECQCLQLELEMISEALTLINEKLNDPNITDLDFENLYKEEFHLTVNILKIKKELDAKLLTLIEQPDMKFMAKRIQEMADELIKVEVVFI